MSKQSIFMFICIGLVLISASPVPQDGVTTEDTSLRDEELIPKGTIGPDLVNESNDDTDTTTNNSISEDGNEETEGEESATEKEETSNDDVIGNEDKDLKGDESEENDSHNGDDDDDLENCDENEESISKKSDSKNGDNGVKGDEATDDQGPIQPSNDSNGDFPSTVISNLFVNGYQLRVVEEDKGNKKVICQLLLDRKQEILDKKCVEVASHYSTFVDDKVINTLNLPGVVWGRDEYTCQVVTTVATGAVQQLCLTHDGWIFDPVDIKDNLSYAW